MSDQSLIKKINLEIIEYNKKGKPVIFVICGKNCSGKTVLSCSLLKKIDFYQSVNLGIISKMIRFFKKDILSEEFENFNGNRASNIFKNLVDFIIDCYAKTGVNIIIEGVQIDTESVQKNEKVLGGVILDIKPALLEKRGEKPETHFKRSTENSRIKTVKYIPTSKFILVDNNGRFKNTVDKTLYHLDYLLKERLEKHE